MHRQVKRSNKGIVPIIAVAVLTILALVVTGVFASEINVVVRNPTPSVICGEDSVLMKHYGYSYAKIVLKSNVEDQLNLIVSIIGEDGKPAWVVPNLILHTMESLELGVSGPYGSSFRVGKTYILKIEGDLSMTYTLNCKGVEISRNKLVILAITGFGESVGYGISNSSAVIQGVTDTADKLGIPYEKVTTIERWTQIMSQSEEGLMIVNPFGGMTPAPTSALSDAETYVKNISALVCENGWTWIHVGGEPFTALGDGNTTNVINPTRNGVEWFFNSTLVTIDSGKFPQQLELETLTEDDGNSLNYFMMVTNSSNLLPLTLKFNNPINLNPSDIPLTKFIFYDKSDGGVQTGSRSIYMGTGYYVHWGGPLSYTDYDSGAIALMISLFTNVR